jgi:BirA family biotin operon repressor/biotin-[acetyl-CoA-carboxylase] ligase
LYPSLNPSNIGSSFIEIATIESTNNYATGQVQNGTAKHGTAWFAHNQTAGKGQRGKTWITEPSANIILSIAVDTSSLLLSKQFSLSVAVALAAQQLFSKYSGDETFIKWPNDIYWRDRKAAGILIENIVQGQNWQWAIIGFGMNINQVEFPELPLKPVSLKQVTGKAFSTVELAKEFCSMLNERWNDLLKGKETEQLGIYNELLFKRNEKVKLKKGNRIFEAVIKEVNEYGELVVFTNTEEHFSFGEIEWLI